MNNRDVLLDPKTGTGHGLESLSATRLSSLVADAPALARELLAKQDDERFDAPVSYRNVAGIMAEALRRHDDALFEDGSRSLMEIYRIGDFDVGLLNQPPPFEASLWESIVIEVFALGGLAVSEERWAQVRALALNDPNPEGAYRYVSWVRHGQVHSSRSVTDPADSLLSIAAARLHELRPHVSINDALTIVCQFDLLAGLLIAEVDPEKAFPNAAAFSEARVEPLVIEHLRREDSPVRDLFVGDADSVRAALRAYSENATAQAAFARAGGLDWEWRSFSDARTWLFIRTGQRWEDWQDGGGWS